jgi:predicted DNA-binding protein (MmcQ/YjbR family)
VKPARRRVSTLAAINTALRAHAFALPAAVEDHPWGESVAKVGGKVFVFFGREDHPDGPGFSVKLPESRAAALQRSYCEPTGYGLGRHGWVTVRLIAEASGELATFRDWIEESYRAVAPRRLLKELEEPS